MNYSSSCLCGKVSVSLTLSNPIENYDPRECDCEFCQLHEIIYISDAKGEFTIGPIDTLTKLKQGSEQATFWQCSSCKQIVAVTCKFTDEIRGAVNGVLFSKESKLKTVVTVSPKFLSPTEKRERWSTSWLQVNFDAY